MPEVLAGVVVVVQMQLDLAESGPAELGQRIEVLPIIFFDREEKCVTRRPAVGVPEPCKPGGILPHPECHSRSRQLGRGKRSGLEVIGETDHDMDRNAGTRQITPSAEQIGPDPEVQTAPMNFPREKSEPRECQRQYRVHADHFLKLQFRCVTCDASRATRFSPTRVLSISWNCSTYRASEKSRMARR